MPLRMKHLSVCRMVPGPSSCLLADQITCCVSRMEQGEGSVTDASARIMMKRGVMETEGGVRFTRDLRHKVPSLYGYSEDMAFEFARNIKCPHLLIKVRLQNSKDDILNVLLGF